MKTIKSQSGFSLIEIMLNLGIFSLVALTVISFFIWTVSSYSKLQSMDQVTKNINIALTTMVYEIREAEAIYYPTSTSTQISMKTRHNTPDNEDFSFIDIYLCDTSVCIKRDGEAIKRLTSDHVEVTNLEFTQIATSTAPSIYINISVRNSSYSPNRADNYSMDFHSAATLRSL